jgi:hypothetical protein
VREGGFNVYRHVYDRANTGTPSFPSRLRRPGPASVLVVNDDGTVLSHTGRNPGKEVISFQLSLSLLSSSLRHSMSALCVCVRVVAACSVVRTLTLKRHPIVAALRADRRGARTTTLR